MDLATFWFFLIGVLFVGYFVLDGFDFGVGMSLPFLSKDDTDRRVLLNTIGPVWDLNETWLIVAGAALFASFPEAYATLFSGFYLALLVILIALICRGVSFEYRHKGSTTRWRRSFDIMIIVGSAVPALLWGVAFANIVRGVPLDANHDYIGTFFTLLNPYALLGGLTTLVLFFAHGVVFVSLKTDGEIRTRARALAARSGVAALILLAGFLLWTTLAYGDTWSGALALASVVAMVAALLVHRRAWEGWAFGFMAATITLSLLSLWLALFPDIIPASNDPANSLTVENASSSTYSLTIMTWAAVIFLPLVIAYQGWTYWVFRHRVTREHIPATAEHR
ncbi:MAG: cytochrome d ubiquinol oxidase subunit II [Microbacteriaceae bacterium]